MSSEVTFLSFKKSMVPIIVMVLVLLVSVLLYKLTYTWFKESISIESISHNYDFTPYKVHIKRLNGNALYVQNNNNILLNYSQIMVGTRECNVSGLLEPNKLNVINLSDCLLNLGSGTYQVSIFTNYGIFSEEKYLHYPIS